jgi:hypothetical protein
MPAFRRWADPFIINVAPTTASTQVSIASDPKYPGPDKARAFRFVNSTPFYVRMVGSTTTFNPVTATTGWLFAPGVTEVYASQAPQWVSLMTIDRAGITGGIGVIELSYGQGD